MRNRSEVFESLEATPEVSAVDVLIFNHTSIMSGGEIALLDLLREGLADSAHVHVDRTGPLTEVLAVLPGVTWSAARSSSESDDADHLGTVRRCKAIVLRLKTLIKMRRDYARVLSRIKSRTIYANTLRSVLVLSTLPLHGRQLVFHQRDQLTSAYLGRVSSAVSWLLIRSRVSHIIANSSNTAQSSPLPSMRTSVIPSAVANAFYDLQPAPSSTTPRLVMLGRLSPWKGQLEFLKSLLVLRDELDNRSWKADIVGGALFGESEYENELRTFIHQHHLDDQVTMRGHVSGVESVLATSHILVHASILPEPFGQVVAQGMAAARAVVAANSGGPLEIIDHQETGILVDPKQSLQFANVLDKLLSDEDLRKRLGASARHSAERYRVHSITRQVSEVLANGQSSMDARQQQKKSIQDIRAHIEAQARVPNDEQP